MYLQSYIIFHQFDQDIELNEKLTFKYKFDYLKNGVRELLAFSKWEPSKNEYFQTIQSQKYKENKFGRSYLPLFMKINCFLLNLSGWALQPYYINFPYVTIHLTN